MFSRSSRLRCPDGPNFKGWGVIQASRENGAGNSFPAQPWAGAGHLHIFKVGSCRMSETRTPPLPLWERIGCLGELASLGNLGEGPALARIRNEDDGRRFQ